MRNCVNYKYVASKYTFLTWVANIWDLITFTFQLWFSYFDAPNFSSYESKIILKY